MLSSVSMVTTDNIDGVIDDGANCVRDVTADAAGCMREGNIGGLFGDNCYIVAVRMMRC